MQFSFFPPLPPPPPPVPSGPQHTPQDGSSTSRTALKPSPHLRFQSHPPGVSSSQHHATPSASFPPLLRKMNELDQLEPDGGIELDMLDGGDYQGAGAPKDPKDGNENENLDMNDYGLPLGEDDGGPFSEVEAAVAGVALFNAAGKRARGRPKGTKNQSGHKAGRPKNSGLTDDTPSPKRLRDEDSPYLDAQGEMPSEAQRIAEVALAATHAQIAAAIQSHQQGRDRDLHRLNLHGLDIPVDPALTALTLGNGRVPHSLLTMNDSLHGGPSAQSISEASDYGRAYAMGDAIAMAGDATGIAGTYFDRGGSDDSPMLGSDALNLAGGRSNRLSRADKGKGIAVGEQDEPQGLEGEIRRAFSKDFGTVVPRLSGPYLLTMVDGEQRLEPTVDANAAEINPGPVYVYLANFEPARHAGPPPVAHDWKTTDPYKKDGKPRARGPRKCGHCGKTACKGRGGRSWCDQYHNGQPSTSTRRMRGTVTEDAEEDGREEEQTFGENILDDNALHAGVYDGQGSQLLDTGMRRTRALLASTTSSTNSSPDLLTDPNLTYDPSFVDPGLEEIGLYDGGGEGGGEEVVVEEQPEVSLPQKKGKRRRQARS